MSKQYSISEARKQLPSLVHSVEDGEAVELTRRGRTVAFLVSKREFEALRPRGEDPWTAIMRFRASENLEELDADDVWSDVRDRTPRGHRAGE